jgi:hypothetical protein
MSRTPKGRKRREARRRKEERRRARRGEAGESRYARKKRQALERREEGEATVDGVRRARALMEELRDAIERPAASPPEQCSWCGAYGSEADRARAEEGEAVSHGMCERCAALPEEERDALARARKREGRRTLFAAGISESLAERRPDILRGLEERAR